MSSYQTTTTSQLCLVSINYAGIGCITDTQAVSRIIAAASVYLGKDPSIRTYISDATEQTMRAAIKGVQRLYNISDTEISTAITSGVKAAGDLSQITGLFKGIIEQNPNLPGDVKKLLTDTTTLLDGANALIRRASDLVGDLQGVIDLVAPNPDGLKNAAAFITHFLRNPNLSTQAQELGVTLKNSFTSLATILSSETGVNDTNREAYVEAVLTIETRLPEFSAVCRSALGSAKASLCDRYVDNILDGYDESKGVIKIFSGVARKIDSTLEESKPVLQGITRITNAVADMAEHPWETITIASWVIGANAIPLIWLTCRAMMINPKVPKRIPIIGGMELFRSPVDLLPERLLAGTTTALKQGIESQLGDKKEHAFGLFYLSYIEASIKQKLNDPLLDQQTLDQIKIQALAHFNASLQPASETQPSVRLRGASDELLARITSRTDSITSDDEDTYFDPEDDGNDSDIRARAATPAILQAPAVTLENRPPTENLSHSEREELNQLLADISPENGGIAPPETASAEYYSYLHTALTHIALGESALTSIKTKKDKLSARKKEFEKTYEAYQRQQQPERSTLQGQLNELRISIKEKSRSKTRQSADETSVDMQESRPINELEAECTELLEKIDTLNTTLKTHAANLKLISKEESQLKQKESKLREKAYDFLKRLNSSASLIANINFHQKFDGYFDNTLILSANVRQIREKIETAFNQILFPLCISYITHHIGAGVTSGMVEIAQDFWSGSAGKEFRAKITGLMGQYGNTFAELIDTAVIPLLYDLIRVGGEAIGNGISREGLDMFMKGLRSGEFKQGMVAKAKDAMSETFKESSCVIS